VISIYKSPSHYSAPGKIANGDLFFLLLVMMRKLEKMRDAQIIKKKAA